MDRREHVRQPIRLRVTFKTVRALVSEYTTSVSKGGCTIRAKAAIEPGTTFVFELSLEESTRKSLEIEGRVIHATPAQSGGGFDIGIEYQPASSPRRIATTRFLDAVFSEQLANRKHARVPVNLVAEDLDDRHLHYLIRDLSRGGMGIKVPIERDLPRGLKLSDRASIALWHDGEIPFEFEATVVRVDPKGPKTKQAAIGLRFDELSEANQRAVDALLYLHRPRGIQIRFHIHKL